MSIISNSKVFDEENLQNVVNDLPMEDIEKLVSKGYNFTIENGVITKVEKECEKH